MTNDMFFDDLAIGMSDKDSFRTAATNISSGARPSLAQQPLLSIIGQARGGQPRFRCGAVLLQPLAGDVFDMTVAHVRISQRFGPRRGQFGRVVGEPVHIAGDGRLAGLASGQRLQPLRRGSRVVPACGRINALCAYPNARAKAENTHINTPRHQTTIIGNASSNSADYGSIIRAR
jgi:hypothetical protein